ncbi:MFS transporter [Streptomyces mayteni]
MTATGAGITAMAVPLQIYQTTGSSAWIGLSAVAGLGPLVLAALWGGVLADTLDLRRLLLATNGGLALAGLLLWAQAAAGLDSVAVLFVLLALLQGCLGANTVARRTVVPRLVEPELRAAANSLDATVRWFGPVAGPLLAGALLPVTGVAPLYLLDAFALLAMVHAVWRLPPLPPADRRPGPRLAAGVRYLSGHRVLIALYLADLVAMVFGNPAALFAEVSQQTFGDPEGGGLALGVLSASLSAGAVLAGLCSGTFTRLTRHGLVYVAAVCVWGLAVAAFGLTGRLWAATCCLLAAGGALMLLSVFRATMLQACVPDELRGRLQGLDTVVSAGGPWLAVLAHGLVGATAGTTWAITGGGLLAAGAVLGVALAFPELVRYRSA